jgi:hypothetical protein
MFSFSDLLVPQEYAKMTAIGVFEVSLLSVSPLEVKAYSWSYGFGECCPL